MVLISEIRVQHPDMALVRTIDAHPEATIRAESQPLWRTSGPVVFISITAPDADAVADSIAADPTVTDSKTAETGPARTIYRVGIDRDAAIVGPSFADLGIRVDGAVGVPGGWTYTLKLPDREALLAVRDHCADRDVSFSIAQLYHPVEADGDAPRFSTCLHDTLVAAYEAGYFEIPRDTSQAELAAQLDVSPSGLSQRIRQGTRILLDRTIHTQNR